MSLTCTIIELQSSLSKQPTGIRGLLIKLLLEWTIQKITMIGLFDYRYYWFFFFFFFFLCFAIHFHDLWGRYCKFLWLWWEHPPPILVIKSFLLSLILPVITGKSDRNTQPQDKWHVQLYLSNKAVPVTQSVEWWTWIWKLITHLPWTFK